MMTILEGSAFSLTPTIQKSSYRPKKAKSVDIYGRSVIDKENFSIRLLEFFLWIPIFSDTIFQLDFCKIYFFLIFFFLF